MQKALIAIGKAIGLVLIALLKGLWLLVRGIFIGFRKLSASNERSAAKRHRNNVRELTAMRLNKAKKQDSSWD